MALRTIVKDGDPILKKVCRPVTKFDDRLATLLDGMKAACLSPATTALLPAPKRSRSRHRTATATGLNWKPKTCWPAASSTRTTT